MAWLRCNTYQDTKVDPVTFSYTGGMQSYTVQVSGTYKLEVWGAQGSYARNSDDTPGPYAGGKGGYSVGNVTLMAGDTIYICVGGQPQISQVGGYNGGGSGIYAGAYGVRAFGGGGGGATHISKTNTLLKNTAVSNIFIVAGGGGGATKGSNSYVGAGGGSEGGYGGDSWPGGFGQIPGGSQTEAGGKTAWTRPDGTVSSIGGFGYGGDAKYLRGYSEETPHANGGGGGGYYGGGGGISTEDTSSYGEGGSGGSGYIGGVTNGTTTAGQREGHGQAKISKV